MANRAVALNPRIALSLSLSLRRAALPFSCLTNVSEGNLINPDVYDKSGGLWQSRAHHGHPTEETKLIVAAVKWGLEVSTGVKTGDRLALLTQLRYKQQLSDDGNAVLWLLTDSYFDNRTHVREAITREEFERYEMEGYGDQVEQYGSFNWLPYIPFLYQGGRMGSAGWLPNWVRAKTAKLLQGTGYENVIEKMAMDGGFYMTKHIKDLNHGDSTTNKWSTIMGNTEVPAYVKKLKAAISVGISGSDLAEWGADEEYVKTNAPCQTALFVGKQPLGMRKYWMSNAASGAIRERVDILKENMRKNDVLMIHFGNDIHQDNLGASSLEPDKKGFEDSFLRRWSEYQGTFLPDCSAPKRYSAMAKFFGLFVTRHMTKLLSKLHINPRSNKLPARIVFLAPPIFSFRYIPSLPDLLNITRMARVHFHNWVKHEFRSAIARVFQELEFTPKIRRNENGPDGESYWSKYPLAVKKEVFMSELDANKTKLEAAKENHWTPGYEWTSKFTSKFMLLPSFVEIMDTPMDYYHRDWTTYDGLHLNRKGTEAVTGDILWNLANFTKDHDALLDQRGEDLAEFKKYSQQEWKWCRHLTRSTRTAIALDEKALSTMPTSRQWRSQVSSKEIDAGIWAQETKERENELFDLTSDSANKIQKATENGAIRRKEETIAHQQIEFREKETVWDANRAADRLLEVRAKYNFLLDFKASQKFDEWAKEEDKRWAIEDKKHLLAKGLLQLQYVPEENAEWKELKASAEHHAEKAKEMSGELVARSAEDEIGVVMDLAAVPDEEEGEAEGMQGYKTNEKLKLAKMEKARSLKLQKLREKREINGATEPWAWQKFCFFHCLPGFPLGWSAVVSKLEEALSAAAEDMFDDEPMASGQEP